MSKTIIKYSIVFLLYFTSSFVVLAQDNISDLSIEELAHIGIHPKSAGILYKKQFNRDLIYVGLLIPFTADPELALEIKNAVELAFDDINLQGGVLGKKLELVVADDGDATELAVVYTDSLVKKYKISALIGPTNSPRLLHLAKYYPTPPTLIISPSTTSPEISDLADNDLVWRTTPSYEQEANIAADYIFNTLKKRSAGILYMRDAYGIGLCKAFKDRYKGKIVLEANYSPRVNYKTFDFSEKIDSLLMQQPEVLYLVTGRVHTPTITHHISKSKMNGSKRPVIFRVDAVKSQAFLEQADTLVVEGMYGVSLATASSQSFRQKFFNKHGKYPVSPYCERAYDIPYILALAMEEAKSTNYLDVKEKLRSVTEDGVIISPDDFSLGKRKIQNSKNIRFEGASGQLVFDSKGDVSNGKYEIWKISNGKFTTMEIQSYIRE